MGSVWDALPTTLAKLVVDVGYPVRLDASDSKRPIYLKQECLKPLINYTNLNELRIFGMRDSYQSIIWETVYRNQVQGGMRVLDLHMAAPPLVRQKSWVKAKDVHGLTVPVAEVPAYKYVLEISDS